jgi:hypothetical protein
MKLKELHDQLLIRGWVVCAKKTELRYKYRSPNEDMAPSGVAILKLTPGKIGSGELHVNCYVQTQNAPEDTARDEGHGSFTLEQRFVSGDSLTERVLEVLGPRRDRLVKARGMYSIGAGPSGV